MLVKILDEHAQKIEHEKLKVARFHPSCVAPCAADHISLIAFQAIGLRNLVESEAENRIRKQQALQSQTNEKIAELDRFVVGDWSRQRKPLHAEASLCAHFQVHAAVRVAC